MTEAAAAGWTANGGATVTDPTGLHARPAVTLTKLAKTFDATIEIAAASQQQWVNAKSPIAVMKLKAPHGEGLQVRAAGTDAACAVLAIVALVERNFES
jgi:phosphocarrier protein HPr